MRRSTGIGMYGFVCTVLAAFLTAFYSWRLLFMTFHGKPRADHHVMEHVHESPPVMLVPLVRAGGRRDGRRLGAAHLVHRRGLAGVLERQHLQRRRPTTCWQRLEHVPGWVDAAPLVVGAARHRAGLRDLHGRPAAAGARSPRSFRRLYRFLLNKWYFDELYDAHLRAAGVRAGAHCSGRSATSRIIDGVPNGLAALTTDGSRAGGENPDRLARRLCLRHADRRRRAGQHLHAVPVIDDA